MFYRENILSLFGDALHQTEQLTFCRDDQGKPVYTTDEQLTILNKIIAIYKILLEEGDYNFFAQFMESAHRQSARLYAEKKDGENTLACLRKMAEFALVFMQYPADAVQTSLLFRGVKYGGWVKNTPGAVKEMAAETIDYMAHERFDFVRDTKEFAEILALLKNNA